MIWHQSNRADPRARDVADRHYNRQKPGTPQFVPPGRCCVFFAETETGKALWVTSFPYAQYVKHQWAGAWVCSAFRNEGAGIASEMIRQAVAATRAHFGEPPSLGMITFIDPQKVKPTKRHGKDTWGLTYEKAGFHFVGKTKGGLLAFQLLPEDMPPAENALPPSKERRKSDMEIEYGSEKVNLFRCPFCGSDPEIHAYRNRGWVWFRIRCSNKSEACRMAPETAAHKKLVESAADWNQRDWNQVPGGNQND